MTVLLDTSAEGVRNVQKGSEETHLTVETVAYRSVCNAIREEVTAARQITLVLASARYIIKKTLIL